MGQKRNKLLEMLDDGMLEPTSLARSLLCWLSDDDCARFAHAEEIELDEEEDAPSYRYDDEEEVREAFAEHWAERLQQCPAYVNDKPAKRQAFSCFVDDLERAGDISEDLASEVTLEGDD